MEKILEEFIDIKDDKESLTYIGVILSAYPTEKGYRVETFLSPKFVRITVYKMGE